jgi:hypothetical protein
MRTDIITFENRKKTYILPAKRAIDRHYIIEFLCLEEWSMSNTKAIYNPGIHKASVFRILSLLIFDKLLYRPFWAFWIIAFVGTTMMYSVDTLGIWLSEPARYYLSLIDRPSLIVLDGMANNTSSMAVEMYRELQKRLNPVEFSVMYYYGAALIYVGLAFYVVYIAYFFYLLRFFRHFLVGFAVLSFFFVGCSFWPKAIVSMGYETLWTYGRSMDSYEGPINYVAWYISNMDYITVRDDINYESSKGSYESQLFWLNRRIDHLMTGSNEDKFEKLTGDILKGIHNIHYIRKR